MKTSERTLSPCGGASSLAPFDRHFTPQEIAALWCVDENTIRRLFLDEPGVLRLGNLSKRGKRSYVTLRIPAAVAERVYRERTR